jgi:hypothetical protein
MDQLLSGAQLHELWPSSVLVLQSQLDNYSSLGDLLGSANTAFVLLEEAQIGPDVAGHWVAILKRPGDVVYFDPYGGGPQAGERMVQGRFREGDNIQDLLATAGTKVLYDTTRFQRKSPEVATCGRWCALRAAMRDLGVEQFRSWVIDTCRELNMQPDNLAVFVTDRFL